MSAGPATIALRRAVAADEASFAEVYASTRLDELEPTGWSDDEKRQFLRSQFSAQTHAYAGAYPDGEVSAVVRGDDVIGRLYLGRPTPDELRVVDVALLPEHRGRGIGTRLMADVLVRADANGWRVTLHVESWNPALRLYDRLGFRAVEERGIYLFLERPAAAVATAFS